MLSASVEHVILDLELTRSRSKISHPISDRTGPETVQLSAGLYYIGVPICLNIHKWHVTS